MDETPTVVNESLPIIRTTKPSVLLTDTFIEEHADRLGESFGFDVVPLAKDMTPADIGIRLPRHFDAAYFSHDCFPDRASQFFVTVLKTPTLKWLHTMSAGVDSPVFGTIRQNGATLTSSSGSSAVSIAQTVVMYLLALRKQLPQVLRNQDRKQWTPLEGFDLQGSKTLVLGYGPIAQETIRLGQALGMHMTAMRRAVQGNEICETLPFSMLATVLPQVDQVVLALPLTPDTNRILDAQAIALLASHSVVVNIGRGDLVDEPALISALSKGQIAGAALDVFVTEPLPETSPLWTLPNVIVSPHMSARTPSSRIGATEIFFENARLFLAGEPMRNEVS